MFKLLKESITPLQVAQRYLGKPNRMGFYISPFRREKTASFKVSNEKGFHDFGDSTHYDIISFTSKYFNCTIKEACDILSRDFGIGMQQENDYTKFLRKQREQEERLKKKIEIWYNELYDYFTSKYKTFRNCYFILLDSKYNESLKNVTTQMLLYDWLCDYLYEIDTLEDKIELYKNRKEVEKYVRLI